MMLTTKGRYAVMAMVEMAGRGACGPSNLACIAVSQEIPLSYLEQIFMGLKKGNLVKSVRGPGGGYLLGRPAEEIVISDIMLAVEEPLKMTRCGKKDAGCMHDKSRCLTHDLWEGLGERIFEYLNGITLADVCGRRTLSLPPEGSEGKVSV